MKLMRVSERTLSLSSILDNFYTTCLIMISFVDVKVKVKEENGNKGTYEISPLPKGYGNTLANSFRRILLSSLEGAGITSIKMKGLDHEYSTLKGVQEDVLEIILNLKQVKFKVSLEGPQTCYLEVSGKKEITAKDITVSAGVEVATKDVKIATLTGADSKVSMEIVVESGVGYKEADEALRSEAGRIPLDTDFSPIVQIDYEVGQARKGQETNLDSVILGIETDGSIEPKEALIESSKILQDFSGKVMVALGMSTDEVSELEEEANQIPEVVEEEPVVEDEVNGWKIEDLPISKRSKSGLLAGGFETVGDIAKAKIADLLELPGFGNKSLNEVVDLMNQYGIELKAE